MKTQKIDDDRFDMAYINFEKTFYGEEIDEEEIVYHVRRRINGRTHWREIKAPKSTLHTSEGKEFYLSSLDKGLNQITTG